MHVNTVSSAPFIEETVLLLLSILGSLVKDYSVLLVYISFFFFFFGTCRFDSYHFVIQFIIFFLKIDLAIQDFKVVSLISVKNAVE